MTSLPWTYDQRPDTRTTNVRLGIWLFLASEAMFFGSLFSAYVLLRTGATAWPDPSEIFGWRGSLLNTILLVAAALLVPASRRAAEDSDRRGTQLRLLFSAGLGVLFIVLKILNYRALLHAGLHPSNNLMLACWFTLTLIHALHVAGGVAANLWIASTTRVSHSAQLVERLHATRLYWSFVDIVWFAILVAFSFS